jgi:hypothetical protein
VWTPPRDAVVPPVPWRRLVVAGAIAAAALAGATALIVPEINEGKRAQERRDRIARAAFVRRETARLRRDQAPHRGRSERHGRGERFRRAVVSDLERAITADARARARAGVLNPPILQTSCEPAADEPRAGARARVWSCLAVRSRNESVPGYPFETGYPFIATVDFDEGSFVWCKTNPPPGEGARGSGVRVAVSRACAGRLAERFLGTPR